MANDAATKAEWVRRVLSVDLSAGPGTGTSQGSLRALGSCRLEWIDVCTSVRREIAVLQGTIIASYQGEPPDVVSEVTERVAALDGMVSEIDESFADVLDDVMNAAPGPGRDKLLANALRMLDSYRSLIGTDPDFSLLDENEFYPTGIKSVAETALSRIGKTLASLRAA